MAATPKYTLQQVRSFLDIRKTSKSTTAATREFFKKWKIQLPRSTAREWLYLTEEQIVEKFSSIRGVKGVEAPHITRLKDENRELKTVLKTMQREQVSRKEVRNYILEVKNQKPDIPGWLTNATKASSVLGVPSLLCSDWHWGETVNGAEIHQANKYDISIAQKRVQRLVQRVQDMLLNRLANPTYDGFVLMLAGDMISGDIHEELSRTNDRATLPTILDLYGVLIWVIENIADSFGKVFVPCVTGNHGRNTKKIQAKERWATNFDWLMYCLLEKHFKDDSRISFAVSESPDILFRIFNHSYLLTHGDQFRGGDGLIGPIGPLTRGRHKKSSRDASLDKHWDTMVCGHFHTLMQLPHLIVNSSLVGFNEYAYANNFTYERPAQACWITHPKQGITIQLPIYLEDDKKQEVTEWVTLPAN